MILNNFLDIVRWWFVLGVLGVLFLPLTRFLFPTSKDSFYIFSKVIGIALVSYIMFLLGTFHILPFTFLSLFFILFLFLLLNLYLWKRRSPKKVLFSKVIIFEEILFFFALTLWSFVRGFEPSIHGLEKFMDFGFVNSILRSTYFPPKDMWFPPFSINYYFFGHLYTAVLTRLSGIPSYITFNLSIATIFAFALTGGFSLLYNFLSFLSARRAFFGGLLGGLLLSLGGNLHTIYSLFTAYTPDHPVPLWNLPFAPYLFPNNYWYPNATRFIPFTIHEFPIYSFVVSDLHGHVTDIPFVLLSIAFLYTVFQEKKLTKIKGLGIALLLAIMYMTNAWDGAIYLFLLFLILAVIHKKRLTIKFFKRKRIRGLKKFISDIIFEGGLTAIFFALFTLPFSLHFKPFVSGIGVLCAPAFLTNTGKIGPLLFEANHCQKSPFYQLVILYGFFFFFALIFIGVLAKLYKSRIRKKTNTSSNTVVLLLILLSVVLIIIPEFIYVKDIYPQHYRANTMFKLVYQAFIMLSLSSAYIIVYLLTVLKNAFWRKLFIAATFILLVFVFIYPYFAVKSYYGDLKTYKGLNGINYLETLYPGDLETIMYLNKSVAGQPVILEAQGDSYTDYERISANTGLPTVLGWTVHEWLWRGTYDVPAPRISEVQAMYNGTLEEAVPLLKKYQVVYVVVGLLEHQKYPNLNEEKFKKIGKAVFTSSNGQTTLYKLTRL